MKVLVLLVAAGLVLQEATDCQARDARDVVSGRCRTAEGEPWANAEVRCFARPLGRRDAGAADDVAVTSDARGRFRAKLLPGLAYSVWAISSQRELASAVVERVVAGSRVELVAGPAPRLRSCRLVIDDREAWPRELEFRLVWMIGNPRIDPLSERDGVLPLPAVPRADMRIECWSKSRHFLAWRELALGELRQKEVSWSPATRPRSEVVVRTEGGKALVGATLLVRPVFRTDRGNRSPLEPWNHERRWFPVASSDAEGRAAFRPPGGNVEEVLVRAAGHASAFHSLRTREPVTLKRRAARRVRVLVDGERPLVGARVLLLFRETVRWMYNGNELTRHVDEQPRLATTDEDGGIAVPGDAPIRLELLLDDSSRSQIGARARGRSMLLADLGESTEPTAIRIDQLVRRRVRVTREGMPQRGARVCLVSSPDLGHNPAVSHGADRRGEVELWLPPGTYDVLAVAPDAGWAIAVLEKGSAETLSLELEPFKKLLVEVRSADGQPEPRAIVRASGVMWRSTPPFFRLIADWNSHELTRDLDSTGRFEARLIPVRGQSYSVHASDRRGERRFRPMMNLHSDGLPKSLTLPLPPAEGGRKHRR